MDNALSNVNDAPPESPPSRIPSVAWAEAEAAPSPEAAMLEVLIEDLKRQEESDLA